ncbi:MAG TPA: DUF6603 domain-containing protein, partial [Longimicrobium sp.]|nr:DUF6603 domain-containing protein [Longimicrobium sp.]
GVAVGGFTFPFSIALASVALQFTADAPVVVASVVQLEADVVKDGFTFPVVARQQGAATQLLSIYGSAPPGQKITLDEIASLIGGSLDGQLPAAGDFPPLDGLQLAGVEVLVFPAAGVLVSADATVTFAAATAYQPFGELITFDGLGVTFTFLPAGYLDANGDLAYVTASVAASATVSGGTLGASVLFPDLSFACVLAPGSTMDLKALVTAAVGDTVSMPAITCTALELFGDGPGKTYRFQATVTDDWTFSLGPAPLSLTSLGFDITHGPAGLSGRITAEFAFAGETLFGLAEFDTGTGGWQFFVGTALPVSIDLTTFAGEVAALFGLELPANAPDLVLTSLQVGFNTATEAFSLKCGSTLEIAGATADFGVEVTQTQFLGYLWVSESYFLVDFATDQRTTLTATWTATDEQAVLTFGDLAEMLGMPAPPVPEGLELDLTAASLTYDFTDRVLVVTAESKTYGQAVFVADDSGGATAWFAALAIPGSIDLSNLPVLGEVLAPSETAAIDALTVIVSSGDITAERAAAVDPLIPAGYPALPATGMQARFGLSAVLDFGGTRFPVALGVAGAESTALTTTVGPAQGASPGSVTATPPAASDGTVWFNLQKTFGPVTFSRAGLRYQEGALRVALDASVSLGGMTLALVGASITTPVTTFAPRFALQGIGLDFRRPPLEIGGGFMLAPSPAPGVSFEYDGSVVVKTGSYSLLAYGSYADVEGRPSLFVFGQATGGFGGPPAFYVTGILAGFGYNSAFRTPGQEEVIDCPLVGGLAAGGIGATPVEALARLTGGPAPWVAPALGRTWLAAGVQFTSYELFYSTALLVADFAGRDLTLELLGVTTATFPRGSGTPYAELQLELEAVLQPSLGFFGIAGNLTPASFLLDRDCVLSGGFAFYLWFGAEHTGDFVITLGGYNPNFEAPDWYPSEPPVGFSWSLGANVSVSGSAYLAVTPSALMAGGGLAVNFHDGALQAWLTAWADMVLWWHPFHFTASIGVSIGASYTLDLLVTSVTLRVELAATLDLWGPPTGGRVHVYWYVISFTVAFGADRTDNPPPLGWEEFTTLLPPPRNALTLAATGGLAAQPVPDTAASDDPPVWHVRGNGFAFTSHAAVPATELYVGKDSTTPLRQDDRLLDIRPMQRSGLTSRHRLWVTLDGAEVDYDGWSFAPATAAGPKALWGAGDGSRLEPGDEQLVPDQLAGLDVVPPPAALGATPGTISVADALGFVALTPGVIPIAPGQPASRDAPVAGENTIALIEGGIMAPATVAARGALYDALAAAGVDPGANGALDRFAREAGELFTAEPLLIPAA